jgi:hypothetical protein
MQQQSVQLDMLKLKNELRLLAQSLLAATCSSLDGGYQV